MNALNLELLQRLEEALSEAERSPAKAVILTGEGPAFSAGADLFEVLDQGSEYIVAPDRLMERATEIAERLAGVPPATFELTKRALRAPTEARVAARIDRDDDQIRALWDSAEVRHSIQSFLAKTFGTDAHPGAEAA